MGTRRSKKWHKNLQKEVLADPEAQAIYEAFKVQLEIAAKLKQARLKAHLTQENIAEKMETTKSAIARLEAVGGKSKHSPSILTLVRYAFAIGYHLQINLTHIRKKQI